MVNNKIMAHFVRHCLNNYLNDPGHVVYDMLWSDDCNFIDACEIGNYEKIFELMPKNYDDWPEGLYAATERGYVSIVKKMIKKMESQKNDKSMSVIYRNIIHISSRYGQLNITKFIINLVRRKYGYDLGVPLSKSWVELGNLGDDFDKALSLAIFNNHIDIVKLLLKNGADIKYGFYCACESGYIKIVRLILGKSNNWESKQFTNGLNLAYDHGHIEIVRLMLDLGAFKCD